MKREWDIEDLIEHFTLSKPERDLLRGKIETHQLGLAVLLKGLQYEGAFFKLKRDIPGVVLEFVAQQLAIEAETFHHYDWSGRTIKQHRAVIRNYLGFRRAQAADRVRLARWLIEQPTLRYEHGQGHWVHQAYEHLRELRIEPFSADKMERIVRSALNTYQNQMCQTIQARLSETIKQQLNGLLDSVVSSQIPAENPWSRLALLKDDPDGANLKTVLEAGEKLQMLRAVGLPAHVFETIDPKWIDLYCQRAIAEHPSDLKRHPDAIRETLLAAFCQTREAEITDQLIDILIQVIHKITTRATRTIEQRSLKEIQRIYGKQDMLFKMAKASLMNPQGSVADVIFKVVSEEKLRQVVQEREDQPLTYRQEVGQVMRRSYGHWIANGLKRTLSQNQMLKYISKLWKELNVSHFASQKISAC